jgi:bifunctional enzyme CysN/CysC
MSKTMIKEHSTQQQTVGEIMKIAFVGHVDHGKSSLVGRIFYDTDSLPEGKFEQIQSMCQNRGMPFEWSFLMDALQAERDQGITIDTAQIWFKTQKRDYVIIDAPGHKEFLKNMISGAANSEAAILVIDAGEGIQEQSKRHGYLLHLLGVKQIAIAVNKMDLVDFSEKRFAEIEEGMRSYLQEIGVTPSYVIPVSAKGGEGINKKSESLSWYQGPTLVEALDLFTPKPSEDHLPLRFSVQDVYKFDERRIVAGRVEAGQVKVGDKLVFSPGNKIGHVQSIEMWHAPTLTQASAGMSVGVVLKEHIFVERGQIASHEDDAPCLTNSFKARLVWLGAEPMIMGKRYKMKVASSEYMVEIKTIEQLIDTDNLSRVGQADQISRHSIAEVVLRVKGLAALDGFDRFDKTGRFVLVDGYHISGGGIIDLGETTDQRVTTQVKSQNITASDASVTPTHRALANHHLGGVLWFSGLSGAGKTTLAQALQQRLFIKGCQVYILDGDNIRHGLNADLGFSPEDRAENIRRVGEVAALFANAGVIVISAFIAPYQADRHRARTAAPQNFHSVYIKADVETCKTRDPKGLYDKAIKGEIKEFTGISAPYEEPEDPDVVIDTRHESVEACVEKLLTYVEANFITPVAGLHRKGGQEEGTGI